MPLTNHGSMLRYVWCLNGSIFALFLCLASSGCLPLRYNTSPGALGVVVDANHHAPIAGAEVVVSELIYPPPSNEEAFTNSRPPVVTTDIGGHFSIPPQRRWDFFVIPIDVFPRFGLLVVKCEGYQSTCLPFWSRAVQDVGQIALKPVKKK